MKGRKIMRINEDSGAVLAAVLLMVAFNGLFLSANGIFMLVAPLTWYELVPG
jgi:NADH:ubiquinone oxidoreductase subunit K